MFSTSKSGAGAYAKVGVETGVTAASPHRLIVMLFDGACVAVVTAKKHMLEKNIAGKGHQISRAINIIENGLRASLDKTTGGEIATNLDDLYSYMTKLLLKSNMENKVEPLDEVHTLLTDIKAAWEQIGKEQATVAPVASVGVAA